MVTHLFTLLLSFAYIFIVHTSRVLLALVYTLLATTSIARGLARNNDGVDGASDSLGASAFSAIGLGDIHASHATLMRCVAARF